MTQASNIVSIRQRLRCSLKFLKQKIAISGRTAVSSETAKKYQVDTPSGVCGPVGIPSGESPMEVKLNVTASVCTWPRELKEKRAISTVAMSSNTDCQRWITIVRQVVDNPGDPQELRVWRCPVINTQI